MTFDNCTFGTNYALVGGHMAVFGDAVVQVKGCTLKNGGADLATKQTGNTTLEESTEQPSTVPTETTREGNQDPTTTPTPEPVIPSTPSNSESTVSNNIDSSSSSTDSSSTVNNSSVVNNT